MNKTTYRRYFCCSYLCIVTLISKNMPKIVIISASVRKSRNSHRIALYFKNYLKENNLADAEILDLEAYHFPLFEERLKFQQNPSSEVIDFAEKISYADGVIIIAPEYNGGYPASLKNVIDLLTDQWYRKPVAISTVSTGDFGGVQMITSLQFILWKLKAWTVPAMFPVRNVSDTFDENGVPSDRQSEDKRASRFIGELLWCIEAKRRMEK